MTFEEIDKLIGDSLTKRYPNTERRDYYELERKWLEKDPNHRKGHADLNGIMYLSEVDYDHYIDVRILKNDVILTFRQDDSKFMYKSFSYDKFTKDHLSFFFYAIDDYFEADTLFDKFNAGKIPVGVLRENRLNEILP